MKHLTPGLLAAFEAIAEYLPARKSLVRFLSRDKELVSACTALLLYGDLCQVAAKCLLSENRGHENFRVIHIILLMQPRLLTKSYGDRAFAVHAPREWNLIPYEIRKSNTISSF